MAGSTEFFDKLKDENNLTNKIAFFNSHPLPEKRIKILKKRMTNNNYILGNKVDLNL